MPKGVRRSFTAKEKLQVVLESFQRDTTIEAVVRKYGIARSVINRWREEFVKRAELVFTDKRSLKERAKAQGFEPGQSPEELKRIIGEYATQVEILKKVQGLLKLQ
jgi:transposase-like protein